MGGINVLEYRCKTSFVTNIVSRSILILLESRTLFVDGIIHQIDPNMSAFWWKELFLTHLSHASQMHKSLLKFLYIELWYYSEANLARPSF